MRARRRTSTATSCTSSASSGFSLIELILVLAIVGIVASVVVVNLDGLLPSSRLAADARRIGSLVAQARQQAALTGQPTEIVYDAQAGTVQLVGSDGTFDVRLSEGSRIEAVLLSDTDTRTGDTVRIRLDPAGGATPHVVHVAGEGGLVYSVEVLALTGAVSYHVGRRAFAAPPQDEPR